MVTLNCGMGSAWGKIRVIVALVVALAALVALATPAPAQDLHSKLEHKRERLDRVKHRAGVLSTTIQRYGERIDELIGQVGVLRNREAVVGAKLEDKRAELRADRRHLDALRVHLHRSLNVLRNRLVDIYRSGGPPDALTVILNSDGFDDLVDRYTYLTRIQQQDASIVGRVRSLRNRMIGVVERVTAERDEIAARQAELERTESELAARQAELDTVRERRRSALANAQDTEHELEGDLSRIQDRIQAQIEAAQEATAVPAAPAGPVEGESSEGFIWPVNGVVVSPFGPRTINGGYENHPGIDIAVPAGTPIRASAAGVVLFTQSEAESGGYGNYTCIDHGGGISTCYAHQSSFAASQGEHVSQGQVIGYTGCTGYCFGDHLHFEVRINGAVTDPMAYLP